MIYRRRASPLHAARAAVALAWCGALLFTALIESNPTVLGALMLSVFAAGQLAGVGRQLNRTLLFLIPIVLTIAAINALVTRQGLTVIWRLGDVPILGQTNITLEATLYGLVLGLRAAILVLIGALYSLAVDPDQMLALMRRWSFHSALSATVATRMVPVLVRDSRRLAEAQRCRPGDPPGRLELVRATTSGVLDRALDVAAALEVRGYAHARRAPRRDNGPWSRQDIAFCASAVALVTFAIVIRACSLAPFVAYPSLRAPAGAREIVVALAMSVITLVGFTQRRGVQR